MAEDEKMEETATTPEAVADAATDEGPDAGRGTKRDRKKAAFFVPETKAPESKGFEVPQATKVKQNILAFSGTSYEDEEKSTSSDNLRLMKFPKTTIHEILDVFDLPRGSGEENHKERQVERIQKFLAKPCPNPDSKDLQAAEEKQKAKGGKVKRKTSAKKPVSKKDEEAAKKEVAKLEKEEYEIHDIYEIGHWKETVTNLLAGYIDTFLKVKTEASGPPEGDLNSFINGFEFHEGIKLDKRNIRYNP
eukprot:gene7825-9294_t